MKHPVALQKKWILALLAGIWLCSVGIVAMPRPAAAMPLVPTTFAACPKLGNLHNTGKDGNQDGDQAIPCFVKTYVNPFIKFFAALVAILVVISVIWGGIEYASSADDPQKVTAAKNRIRNAIIALVCFIFLYAFLQFAIPGGVNV